jgi:hypothetical protein
MFALRLLFFSTILIILFTIFLIENNKTCPCINDWRKYIIKYGNILLLLFIIYNIINQNKFIGYITFITYIIINIIFLIPYLINLKNNCQCIMENSTNKIFITTTFHLSYIMPTTFALLAGLLYIF